MLDWLLKHQILAAVLAGLLVGAGAGFYVGMHWGPVQERWHTERIVEKPTIVQGETKHTTETVVQYVPKETVVVKQPDGTTALKPERTDLEFNVGKPEIVLKLNGKEQTFTKADDEKYMFEKNKLQMEQTSTIKFDLHVEPTVIDRTRRGGIELYAGNKDYGVGVRWQRFGVDIGRAYDGSAEGRIRWTAIQF